MAIDANGDNATCRAYFFGVVSNQGERDSTLIWVDGIYEDQLNPTADGWRITELIDLSKWTSSGPGAG
jgi:hypothetical protein